MAKTKKKVHDKIIFDKRTYKIYFSSDDSRQFMITFFPRAEFCTLVQQGERGKILVRLVTRSGKRNIRPKDMLYILAGNNTLKKRMIYRFDRYKYGIEDGTYIYNLYIVDGQYTDDRPKTMTASSVYRENTDTDCRAS